MFKRFEVAHQSMSPTLLPGDFLLASPSHLNPRRGEIIVFEEPEGRFIIKRIVALEGETVLASAGRVSIDGDENLDRWAIGLTSPFDPITIPSGHVWALGDRRELSTVDSRSLGPIAVAGCWRARIRYFPLGKIGIVR